MESLLPIFCEEPAIAEFDVVEFVAGIESRGSLI